MSAYGSGLSTEYNILDLPQRQTTGEGTVVDYKYAFDGRKLQEKVTTGTSVIQRDYSGEFLYEGGVLKRILFDGGYVEGRDTGPVYMFFLRDHLGSVRAVVSETGAVQQRNNYFPYGDLFPSASNDSSGNRYRYTGKESGDEISLYDFSARFLHTRFGRFTTIDPLAEKYPGISPYAYCNGNPVNFVDPDGQDPTFFARMGIGAVVGGTISATTAIIEGKSFTEVLAATAGGAVDGAMSAAGGKVVTKLFSGLLGGGAGDWVEQKLNVVFGNQTEIERTEIVLSAVFGAVTGTIDGTGETVGRYIEDFYSSDVTVKSIANEIKDNSSRRMTNKKAINEAKKVAEEFKKTEKNMVENATQVITYTWNFYNNLQDE